MVMMANTMEMSVSSRIGREATNVHGVVLVQLGDLLHLAHHHDDGRGAVEDVAILGSQVILPGAGEARSALMEGLVVDLDLRHRRCVVSDGFGGREGVEERKVPGCCWRREIRKIHRVNWER